MMEKLKYFGIRAVIFPCELFILFWLAVAYCGLLAADWLDGRR
jgi:hypothetical protein